MTPPSVEEEVDNGLENLDHEATAKHLARIRDEDPHGLLKPEAVVEAARDAHCPFHSYIWTVSDAEASWQYRLVLARKLITRVKVTMDRPEEVWVNARIVSGNQSVRGYLPLPAAVADPEVHRQIITDARKGIVAYRNRLSAFTAAAPMVGRLDDAVVEADRILSGVSDGHE